MIVQRILQWCVFTGIIGTAVPPAHKKGGWEDTPQNSLLSPMQQSTVHKRGKDMALKKGHMEILLLIICNLPKTRSPRIICHIICKIVSWETPWFKKKTSSLDNGSERKLDQKVGDLSKIMLQANSRARTGTQAPLPHGSSIYSGLSKSHQH